MKIKITGTIVPNDFASVYEWLGLDYTAPKDIELPKGTEDVDVEINSYGGDVYSGSEIYTMLKAYPGKVTTIITGIAASMASIIVMAGDVAKISPTGQIMIHNVSSYTEGNKYDFEKESKVLEGYDKTLANAYRLKTGMSEEELLDLMDNETWLTPQEALSKGFVDEILFEAEEEEALKLVAGPKMLSQETIRKVRAAMAKDQEKKLEAEEVEEIDEEKEDTEEAPEEEKEVSEEEEEEKEEEEEAKADVKKDVAMKAMKNRNGLSFKNEAEPRTLQSVGGTMMDNQKTYKQAFFNAVRGVKLDTEEQALLAQQNKAFNDAFTHDTTNTSILIPRETQDKIWSRAIEGYGVLEDLNRLHVKGELRMVRHKAIEEGDAAWYIESTPTADEKNTFDDLLLKGHELSKAVTVSWKLRAMAMEDFEDFLVREIAERISAALGQAVTQGDGKNQPTGIITAVKKVKEQVVSVAKTGTVTYGELLSLISKVHSSYKAGAKIYANSATIWTVLANIVDNTGRPFFEATAGADGIGNALGFVVKEDASLKDDEILFGNPARGYVFNVNEEMSMTTEEHAKARTTDYVAYMVADGNVIDEKAFAILSLTQAV